MRSHFFFRLETIEGIILDEKDRILFYSYQCVHSHSRSILPKSSSSVHLTSLSI